MPQFFLTLAIALMVSAHTHATDTQAVPQVGYDHLSAMLEEGEDTLYIINFWATWCSPCVKEMPYFEAIADTFASDAVQVLFVSLDMPGQRESRILPFIENHNIRSPVVHLTKGKENDWIPRVDPGWTGSIPATLFVNPAAGQRRFHAGAFTYEELEEVVEEMTR